MPNFTPMTNPARLMAAAIVVALFTGCNEQNKTTGASPRQGQNPNIISYLDPQPQQASGEQPRRRATGLADLDFGDDWADGADAADRAASSDAKGNSSEADSGGFDPTAGEYWAIVLSTFAGENHRQAAATMVSQLGAVDGSLVGQARVHTKPIGSYVIYGRFASPQSPEAKAALQRIRSIKVNNNPVFARAMFTRVNVSVDPRMLRPNDLRRVRIRFPDEHPLYSMEVAVWVAEDDTERGLQDIQRKAEAEAARLRAQGFEAYFFHDSAKRVSSITVGVFTHSDWDAQANLESSRVVQLRRAFPVRLMNGAQVDEVLMRDSKDRPIKTIPMSPRLVLVPDAS